MSAYYVSNVENSSRLSLQFSIQYPILRIGIASVSPSLLGLCHAVKIAGACDLRYVNFASLWTAPVGAPYDPGVV